MDEHTDVHINPLIVFVPFYVTQRIIGGEGGFHTKGIREKYCRGFGRVSYSETHFQRDELFLICVSPIFFPQSCGLEMYLPLGKGGLGGFIPNYVGVRKMVSRVGE